MEEIRITVRKGWELAGWVLIWPLTGKSVIVGRVPSEIASDVLVAYYSDNVGFGYRDGYVWDEE